MRIKEIKDRKLVLSNFGTITTGGIECSIDDFEKMINDGDDDFESLEFAYDSEKKCFTITTISKFDDTDDYDDSDEKINNGVRVYYLYLTDLKKSKLEQGIVDENVQRLIDLAEKSQYKKKLREIEVKALKTGEYFNSSKEMKIYRDYLNEQLIQTNAKLNTNRIVLFSPVISTGLCAVLYNALNYTNNVPFAIFCLTGTCLSVCYSFMGGLFILLERETRLNENKKYKSDLRLLKQKYNCLEKMIAKASFDDSVGLSPERVRNGEVGNANQYNNVFLQEISEVKKLIARLPENERDQYVKDLSAVLAKYIQGVEKIVDKDSTKFEFGAASHIWELNTQMLPEVFKVGAVVKERLATIEEKKEVLNDCQEVKESIEALGTDSLRYTDGWTDDLSSGGVAYAVQKSH